MHPDTHDGLTRRRIRVRACRSHRTYRNTSDWYPANMDRLRYQHGPLLANPANFLHPDLIVTLRRVYQRPSKARHSDQNASIHRNPTWSRNQTAACTAHIHRPYPMHQLITYDTAFSGFSIIWLIGGVTCRKDSASYCPAGLGLCDRRFIPTHISKV